MPHATDTPDRKPARPPRKVSLPAFLIDEDIGLGDAVSRVTGLLGIRACGGCEARAASMNQWMTFTGRHAPGDKR